MFGVCVLGHILVVYHRCDRDTPSQKRLHVTVHFFNGLNIIHIRVETNVHSIFFERNDDDSNKTIDENVND